MNSPEFNSYREMLEIENKERTKSHSINYNRMDKTVEIVLKSNRKIRNKAAYNLFLIAFYPFYSKNKKIIACILISILVALLLRFWIYIGAIIAFFLACLLIKP